jgi:hypothetical protein
MKSRHAVFAVALVVLAVAVSAAQTKTTLDSLQLRELENRQDAIF